MEGFVINTRMGLKAQEVPKFERTSRYWIMSEVEAQFDDNGVIIGFKVIRSFKRLENADKKAKQEKDDNPKQRKIQVEEDERI